MATQAGTRVARAVVESTVVAVKTVDRMRARVPGSARRPRPEGLRATERLWQDTAAPSPELASVVGPEATQALTQESTGKATPLPRQPRPRRKPQAPEAGHKTVRAEAPAGKRATAKARPKKADAPAKAGARKKQAPRRRS
jgi:hypothetical protein